MTARYSLLLCAILSPSIAAQRTWIVDARGAGDFLDLPPAVAAAADGDLIRIRQGSTYNAVTTSKALAILADPNADFAPSSPPMVVQNLPPGRQFTLFGSVLPALSIQSCLGRVLMGGIVRGGVTITDAAHVHLAGVHSSDTTSVTRSTAVLVQCRLNGSSAPTQQPAMVATDATIAFSSTDCIGGWTPSVQSSAVLATRCRLELSGYSIISPGPGLGMPTVPGIVANGVTIVQDAAARILGSPPVQGTAMVIQQRIPSLMAGVGHNPPLFTGHLTSRAGNVAVFLVSLAADPIGAGNGGTIWFDPYRFVVMGVAVVDANGDGTLSLLLPGDPALVGPTFVAQALDLSSTDSPRWSHPSEFVVP